MQLAAGGPLIITNFGPLSLYLFGTLAAAGCVAGLMAALRLARRFGLSPVLVFEIAAPSLLVGLAGARLGYVVTHWAEYRWTPVLAVVGLDGGGFSFYGGLAAGLLAALLLGARRGLPVPRLLDVLAPGLALGQAVGFVGVHLDGRPARVPWAVALDGQAVHPFPAYAIVAAYGLFFICWRLATRPADVRPGRLFLVYLFLHGFGTAVVGAWAAGTRFFGLTAGQWTGLVVGAAAAAALWVGRRRAGTPSTPGRPHIGSQPALAGTGASAPWLTLAAWTSGLLLLLCLFRARL